MRPQERDSPANVADGIINATVTEEVYVVANTESAIWERVIEPARDQLLPEVATAILRFDFQEADHQRMAELAEKCNEGLLTEDERTEYENYVRIGNVLALMQSMARLALKQQIQPAAE